jgi:2-polyprenyl-3-methyl-5-hydroxy-6-metoxy-1,4-benzoquinol methylase
VFRVDVTSSIAYNILPYGGSVADLSCGDAVIAERLRETHNARLTLGDYAPGYNITGPIEKTIHDIDPVDLFICSETVEHLDDPDAVLADIRRKCEWLILSTPDGEDARINNPQHLWGWDAEAMEQMLRAAGFEPRMFTLVDPRFSGCQYAYQIWASN